MVANDRKPIQNSLRQKVAQVLQKVWSTLWLQTHLHSGDQMMVSRLFLFFHFIAVYMVALECLSQKKRRKSSFLAFILQIPWRSFVWPCLAHMLRQATVEKEVGYHKWSGLGQCPFLLPWYNWGSKINSPTRTTWIVGRIIVQKEVLQSWQYIYCVWDKIVIK